jgi:ubiquinone/menaquinone biosynthesis C-methylase UbiE
MDLLANEVELVTELCERLKREKEKTKSKTASLKILDIGCGTGKLAVYLSEETGCAVTGIDPVRANVEKARMKSSSVTFMVQSAEELTFATNTFDFAVSLKALHEIQNPREALREARRVLKEGGKIFIVDWVGGVVQTSSHAHAKKYFSPEQIIEALSETGFVNLSTKPDKVGELMLCEGKKMGLG